jgi:arginase family enzyme
MARTQVLVFPFDLFGSAGTGAGARLLGDAVREIIADTARETRPSRADALRGQLRVRELALDTMAQVNDWKARGRKAARQALASGDFIVWLGGNHLSVLPLLEELGGEAASDTLVVQFDAHLDIQDFHDTTAELSHGNFLKHAAGRLPRIVHVGHRDLFVTPVEIAKTFEAVYPASQIAVDLDGAAESLRKRARSAKRVWIDLDCDAIDPAFLPAVHQPLPFGLSPAAFLKLVDATWEGNVVGLSISEFDPGRDFRDASLNLLGWWLEFILLREHEH